MICLKRRKTLQKNSDEYAVLSPHIYKVACPVFGVSNRSVGTPTLDSGCTYQGNNSYCFTILSTIVLLVYIIFKI